MLGTPHPAATKRGERLYQARNHPLRFLLREGDGDALLVVFASYHLPGRPPRYHYSETLVDEPCHQLFIIDDQGPRPDRPCWYLGKDRDFTVAQDIHELIDTAARSVGVDRVVCAGSSKGGYAATYFALTGGYERALVGEPQTFLGSYLNSPEKRNILQHIAGGNGRADVEWLDRLLIDTALNTAHRPVIEMHAGSGTGYLDKQIRPLLEALDAAAVPYTLDIGNYDHHDELSDHFPAFLLRHAAAVGRCWICGARATDSGLCTICFDGEEAAARKA